MSEPDPVLGDNAAWGAAALVLVAALSGAVLLAEWPPWGVDSPSPTEPETVGFDGSETELWPYTASQRAFDARTLGVNLVVRGDPETVSLALTERSQLEWESGQVQEGDADATTYSAESVGLDTDTQGGDGMIGWDDAEGSVRYTYVEHTGGGQWLTESYQLHTGTYLGQRLHVRAYEDPGDGWTALQAHDEHWDWFRLRHTVTGISDAQRAVERDFVDQPFVDEVVRLPFDNGTADSDGWVTVVRMVALLVPAGALAVVGRLGRTRRTVRRAATTLRREVALGVTLFGLYTAIRFLGIGGELLFESVSPKFVAAPLYVALVVGTPAVAYLIGRGSNPQWAFAFAAGGLAAAFVVDFATMGVSVLPLRVVLHRTAASLAVGLIAVGGVYATVDGRSQPLVVGFLGWLAVLFLPLFGYV